MVRKINFKWAGLMKFMYNLSGRDLFTKYFNVDLYTSKNFMLFLSFNMY